jgi:hypothetical protein
VIGGVIQRVDWSTAAFSRESWKTEGKGRLELIRHFGLDAEEPTLLNQFQLFRPRHCLQTVFGIQFVKDMADMGLGCVEGDYQPGCNLLIG